MLVVVSADVLFAHFHLVLHGRGVQRDIAHLHLLRCDEAVFVLIVIRLQFVVAGALFRLQRLQIDGRQAHVALLQHQRRHGLRFGRQHEAGLAEGLNQLLIDQLLAHRLREVVGGVAHAADQVEVFGVIELAVGLEVRRLADGVLDLIVADRQAQLLGVLVEQHVVDQLGQHLTAHLLHVAFVAGQRGELVTQLLLHAATLALESLFQLSAFDRLTIYFRSIIAGAADQVVTHPGQNE